MNSLQKVLCQASLFIEVAGRFKLFDLLACLLQLGLTRRQAIYINHINQFLKIHLMSLAFSSKLEFYGTPLSSKDKPLKAARKSCT